MQLRVLAFVLAGGKGTRLSPFDEGARETCGAVWRPISHRRFRPQQSRSTRAFYSIYVLTQFKSQSLLQHLREGWEVTGLLKNNFIIPVPAQMRSRKKTGIRAPPTPFIRTST